MTPEVTLIKKCGANPLMSKRIFLDKQGVLRSDGSQCVMTQGVARRSPAATAGDLAKIISGCSSDEAIALGSLKDGLSDLVPITVPRKLRHNPGAITRSRDFIDYRPGIPAWCLIDFDTKGMSADIAGRVEAEGGAWKALLTVAPGMLRAARVSRASTSSGLFRSDTGEPLPGSSGLHVYLLLRDGADTERFLRALHDRCWLYGLGWHVVGAAGQLLERSLIDRMVGYGERLCFEGAPHIVPPLAQDPAKRVPEAFEGEAIDSHLIMPRLTEYERHRVIEAKTSSADALGKVAAEVRSQHDKILAEKISDKSGMPLTTALRLVAARHRGVLLPYIDLDFDHLGIVSVASVLTDPDQFIGETLADPLEGAAYGRAKAKLMKADDDGLLIHSFAHGRGLYRLRHDARSAKAALAQVPANAVVDHAMAILAVTDLEVDELADFVKTVAKIAGVGIGVVKARINKERREREAASRKATIASSADGRIIKLRPEPDGELLPTVTFLDEVLASDQREEPPMRAIMLALTLIERAVLAERPAFFVTAPQRGGGKTTVVHMITLAVLGRRAAAAGWSKSPEERKKALFSYFRQGVAALAWDNIARGSAISCPHIEAALTASEISDRVLGVSRVEVVPSITVQIFTGNSILPRGDMASRSLTLALNVNRPDPENRDFAHPDPLAWTQTNRLKILRALYTILIAGALNRPRDQPAKTRFKSWWSLVGWPVEYAAKLIGITVDCTELLRAGEVGDEEASAVSAILTLFRQVWGDQVFTAKDVVKVMTPEPKFDGSVSAKADDVERSRADAIADALGELIGKRLDRPTAHSLGKLFQKRLVGRPAWIGDGQTVATLQKSTGHNENKYRVDVSAPGQAHVSRDNTSRNIPHIPHIPQGGRPERGKTGNLGKDGNVFGHAPFKGNAILDGGSKETPAWRARL